MTLENEQRMTILLAQIQPHIEAIRTHILAAEADGVLDIHCSLYLKAVVLDDTIYERTHYINPTPG